MDLLKDLNDEQRRAVIYGEGPLLIVAGAGTGKTTVITRRFAWLILSGKARPEEILAITFTEKAAGEMEERIFELLPLGFADLWISTFHSFCEKILRNHGLDIGLPSDFTIISPTEQWLLVRKNFDKFRLSYYRPLGNSTRFIYALLTHFSRAKDEAIGPEEYLEYVKNLKLNTDTAEINVKSQMSNVQSEELQRLEEVAGAYHTYEQVKLQEGALDFGDLITYTLKLFQTRPSIVEQYRQKFRYILVDEFQDTNWAQYELMKILSFPKNNLTVVGDDEQSIYAFRGASMSNILHFKDDYPEAAEIFVTDNFRNKQNVLDFAYQFIQQNNPNRLEYTLKIPKKLKAKRKQPATVEHLHASTGFEEAVLVAKKILDLKEQHQELRFNDFAILVRANNHAENFMLAFERIGIPYQFLASSGLYSKPVVLDIIAYLKLLDNYHESEATYRILTLPIHSISSDDLAKLTHFARRKSLSLYEAMRKASLTGISQEGLSKINRILELVSKHTPLARTMSVGKIIYAFLDDSGYLHDVSGRAEKGDRKAEESIRYLRQFFKKIEEFERMEPDPSVKKFITTFDMFLQAGDEGALSQSEDTGPETVKILTVHGAKGLEFPYVFISQLVELRFPSLDRKEPIRLPDALVKEIVPEGDHHLEEERRLFYVAMTRARDGLYFTSADDYGGTRKKKLSRFLVELGFSKPEVKRPTGKVFFDKLQDVTGGYKTLQEVTESVTSGNLPATFSYTQLKAFETCPLQYKFAHILAVPVKGKASFSFGRSVHRALERFFKKARELYTAKQGTLLPAPKQQARFEPSLNELLKTYDEAWIDEWFEDKGEQERYKKKGKEILTAYFQDIKSHWPDILYLEQPFRIKIGDYTIKGTIDRVDANPVTIVDYKTGHVPDPSSADRDQLLMYQIAAQEALGLKPVSLEYHYLDGNKKISFIGDEKDISALKKKIVSTIEEIKKSDFKATPNIQKCRTCDFKDICDYRILS